MVTGDRGLVSRLVLPRVVSESNVVSEFVTILIRSMAGSHVLVETLKSNDVE